MARIGICSVFGNLKSDHEHPHISKNPSIVNPNWLLENEREYIEAPHYRVNVAQFKK